MGFARGASCGNVPDGKTAVTSSCQQLPNPRLGNRRRRCYADHFCVGQRVSAKVGDPLAHDFPGAPALVRSRVMTLTTVPAMATAATALNASGIDTADRPPARAGPIELPP